MGVRLSTFQQRLKLIQWHRLAEQITLKGMAAAHFKKLALGKSWVIAIPPGCQTKNFCPGTRKTTTKLLVMREQRKMLQEFKEII
jgi:hypothetical protein